MAQPQAYNRDVDFTERDGDDTNHAGINAELDAAALSINQIRDNLALIQRDDGGLQNGIVTAESLAPSAFDAVLANVNEAVQEAQTAAGSATLAATTAIDARDDAQAAQAAAETASNAASLNATTAATSASTATTKASEASTSATNAATSAAAAAASATSAGTSATNAAASATAAGTSATNAATSASTATTQAGIATTAATAAVESFDQFDDRYLGSKTSDPTTDNDGNPLLTGALYFNSVAGEMRVWAGTFWKATGSAVGGTINTAKYTATAGQTTFAIVYDVGFVHVYLNGLKLESGVDFTANNGTNVVLATGATAGDVVDMIAFGIFSVANTYTKPEMNAPTGASLIGFQQSGAGSVPRTVDAALKGTVSVKDFGAVGNGLANDAPAINAAISAVIAAGGGTLYFPAGKYKCTSRIGTFVSAENVTLWGYGAEIQHFAGSSVQGLMQFGNAALDANGMYSASAITVKNLNILGLKFTSSNVFNGAIPGRWSDQMPISINTAKDVLIRDCYFENWDFAAIDFGAICKGALVDACTFYSSQVDAGHANYGVRAFCYANYTSYQNGNGDLSPTDPNTGVLKAGYAYISDTSATWGHENISVTNCYFENVSHGVMLSAARRGVIANNRFNNMSTRSVSLTTYSRDYLCCNNVHSLDTTQQTSTGVSVFYGLGQATFRHQIQGEKFSVIGDTNNATGFGPIKCYINSHDWLIADCRFDIPSWAGSGGRCINVQDNSDGEIRNNHFKCPNVVHPVTTLSAFSVASPGYQQGKIWVIGNIFEAFSTGAMEVRDTTSSPEPIVIKDNIVHGNPTRFVAANFSASGKVARLFLDGNKFLGSPVRYIDNIVTANKAILLNKDVLEIESFLTTGGGVTNPSTTAVSFDFSAYSLPGCFTNGQKRYLFTAYGSRNNGQASTDFFFRITGETATSISGEIVRNAGTSFQIGNVGLKVIFEPFNT